MSNSLLTSIAKHKSHWCFVHRDFKSKPMEALKNAAHKAASHTKRFFQALSPDNTIKDLVCKASRGEMFALVVNEFSIRDVQKCQGACILFIFVLAVLLFCIMYKASIGSFKAIKSTAKISLEFIAMFICIVVVVNIIK